MPSNSIRVSSARSEPQREATHDFERIDPNVRSWRPRGDGWIDLGRGWGWMDAGHGAGWVVIQAANKKECILGAFDYGSRICEYDLKVSQPRAVLPITFVRSSTSPQASTRTDLLVWMHIYKWSGMGLNRSEVLEYFTTSEKNRNDQDQKNEESEIKVGRSHPAREREKTRMNQYGCPKRTEIKKATNLVVVCHDRPLHLRGIHPGDEILHVSSDHVRRVGDRAWAHSDVTLFDIFHRLKREKRRVSFRQKKLNRNERAYTVPTVSAIFNRQATTAKRLLQNPETVTLFSTSDSLFSRLSKPMS